MNSDGRYWRYIGELFSIDSDLAPTAPVLQLRLEYSVIYQFFAHKLLLFILELLYLRSNKLCVFIYRSVLCSYLLIITNPWLASNAIDVAQCPASIYCILST